MWACARRRGNRVRASAARRLQFLFLQTMSPRTSISIIALVGSAFLSTACSGGSNNGVANGGDSTVDDAPVDPNNPPDQTDGGPTPHSSKQPSFTPTFPTVRNRGGKVIAQPHVVPIVFSGDPNTDRIGDFTKRMGGSQYWAGMTQEYGVGAITAEDVAVVDSGAPASVTSDDIEQWLAQAVQQPDPNTLYAVYFPMGTSVTLTLGGESSESCKVFAGYHSEFTVGGAKFAYAALPVCTNFDDLTVTASHEYLEWATDPFPLSAPAWTGGDDAHWAFGIVVGAEVGDRCNGYLDQTTLFSQEVGYQVQRGWSNKLSLAGKFPCSPGKNAPYIQAIADATDDVTIQDKGPDGSPRVVKTKAIKVAPGKSRTVDVHIWSDQATTRRVDLMAKSLADLEGGTPAGFAYTLDAAGTVGSTVKLTIEAPAQESEDIVTIAAFLDKSTYFVWPVLVTSGSGTQASANGGSPSMRAIRRPSFASAPLHRAIAIH
jgi:hypothetical protein